MTWKLTSTMKLFQKFTQTIFYNLPFSCGLLQSVLMRHIFVYVFKCTREPWYPLFSLLQFSKETLANMYSAYIDNFLNAKDAVRIAKEAKPAFHKFLEVSEKLTH